MRLPKGDKRNEKDEEKKANEEADEVLKLKLMMDKMTDHFGVTLSLCDFWTVPVQPGHTMSTTLLSNGRDDSTV